ncbi:unnamed protein product [Aphanomyces euteiches]|uniref:Temptin Cys/Cys disulfide domain-containing protein n=1 Tax=Aphanomyces euteiches TaxID=100861 RepID=A0A6G0XEZ5_9STRA|nr:hypothetical protein Ae201684_005373 [Aphanomyces euteiches]KAH9092491.1 hypothetical protein Ae201684P_008167 [Aphanomyces euteiches]KAH9129676.1 hypothetical protein AeMF1_000275 [Aphanomyces euteiches]KAH9137533.1 hypothetical protein LEN26_005678 [Aphanomyces euteiches]KAH9157692.1 hypothetical protein AeRB84_000502 [Aphanomyces euteiches]
MHLGSWAICLAVATSVAAYDTYRLKIPNGLKKTVDGVSAVGHVNKFGSGRATQFGYDFERLGRKWTKELCEKDSDGDGATNGEELGDPCCTWRVGRPVRANPTSPGHKNDFTDDQLAALKCVSTADTASSSDSKSTDEL